MNAVLKEVPAIDEITASIESFIAEHDVQRVDPEPTHYHTDELYGRRLVVPTGTVFTTKVHKSDHIAVCLRGHIVVLKENGERFEVKAPDVFVTPKGTQRFIYVLDEVEWLTVHVCKEQALDRVEQALVCSTMEEYNRLLEAPK